MKKILKEFVDFLKQGNLVEIATGLLLATAFNTLVKSFTDSFIQPIIDSFGIIDSSGGVSFKILGINFPVGNFISALISFIIVGAVTFLIVKSYNKFIASHQEEVKEVSESELSVLKEIKELLEKQDK
ncbi:MAG: MscL family protein [Erysipelotrichales bacterium]